MGGIPQYLQLWNERQSLAANIKRLFLNPMSPLFEEPSNLLNQELREPALYNALIGAIAKGASKLSEIAGKVGEMTSNCVSYLKNLEALGIVRRELPYGEKTSRRSIYRLKDPLFRFWHRFVADNLALIERGADEIAYARITEQLPAFMGEVFEGICREALWAMLLAGQAPIDFAQLGRWWGSNPQTKSQEEVDIMGRSLDGQALLLGECKWTNTAVDLAVLEKLETRAALFPEQKKWLLLFAKRSFSMACHAAAAESERVQLWTFAELAEAFFRG